MRLVQAARVIQAAEICMPNEFNLKEESEFIQASAIGNIERLAVLLAINPLLINKPASNGSFPLMFAAETATVEAVEWLVSHGATIDAGTDVEDVTYAPIVRRYEGVNALITASTEQRWEIVRALLRLGAKKYDFRVTTDGIEENISGLWFAASAGQWDIVGMLLEAFETPNIDSFPKKDGDEGINGNKSILYFSAEAGEYQIVQALLKQGARFDCYRTSLVESIREHMEGPLYDHNYNQNTYKLFNTVVILKAVEILFTHAEKKTGSLEELNYLLDTLGSGLNACVKGKTLLAVALQKQHQVLIELLIARGANRLDKEGSLYQEADVADLKGPKPAASKLEGLGLDVEESIDITKKYASPTVVIDLFSKLKGEYEKLTGKKTEFCRASASTPFSPSVAMSVPLAHSANLQSENSAASGSATFFPARKRDVLNERRTTRRCPCVIHEEPKEINPKKESKFIQACLKEDLIKMAALVKKNKTLVNIPASNGHTPLILAAEQGLSKTIQWLISNRGIVDATTTLDSNIGATALWYAAFKKNWDVVRLLLNAGASIDAAPSCGRYENLPVIWLAAMADQWALVRELLQNGAKNIDVSGKPGSGHEITILWLAAAKQEWALVLLLLDAGANKLHLLGDGTAPLYTPFYFAATEGNDMMVQTLLKFGSPLDHNILEQLVNFFISNVIVEDYHKNSFQQYIKAGKIIIAAEDLFVHAQNKTGSLEILSQILDVLGPALNGTKKGKTALKVAIENHHLLLVDLLLSRAANCLDSEGTLLFREGEIYLPIVPGEPLSVTPGMIFSSKLSFIKSMLEDYKNTFNSVFSFESRYESKADAESKETAENERKQLANPRTKEAIGRLENPGEHLNRIEYMSRKAFKAAFDLIEPLRSQAFLQLCALLKEVLPFSDAVLPLIKEALLQVHPSSPESYKKACALYVELSLGQANFDTIRVPGVCSVELANQPDEAIAKRERLRRALEAENEIELSILSPLALSYVLGDEYSVNTINAKLTEGATIASLLTEIFATITAEFDKLPNVGSFGCSCLHFMHQAGSYASSSMQSASSANSISSSSCSSSASSSSSASTSTMAFNSAKMV